MMTKTRAKVVLFLLLMLVAAVLDYIQLLGNAIHP
jgi:hypothetical protein